MVHTPFPQDSEVYKKWVQAIIDEASDTLNLWELKFVGDMERILNRGSRLSEGQANKLEEIYVRTP